MSARTLAERQADSLAALQAAGGARKTFRLTSQALQDLAAVQAATGAKTETDAIIEALALAAKALPELETK